MRGHFNKLLSNASHYSVVALAFFIPISTSLTHVFLLLTLAFVLLSGQWRLVKDQVLHNPMVWITLSFFALFLIGLIYSTASWQEAGAMLSKYKKFCYIAFLMPLFVESRWRQYAIFGFIAGGLLTLCVGYLQFFDLIHLDNHYGPSAVFKDRIQTSFVLSTTSFLLAHQAWQIPRWRLYIISILLLLVHYLFFVNVGRSGQIIFLALMLLFFFQCWRCRGFFVAGIAALLLILMASYFSQGFQQRMLQEVKSDVTQYQAGHQETSVGLRLSFIKNSLHLFLQHPWMGTGTGSFAHEYSNITQQTVANPHNEYLMIAVQFGLPGIMVLLSMFYSIWHYSRQLPKHESYLAQGLLVIFLLGNLANSWLLDTTEGHFFIYFVALLFATISNHSPTILTRIPE